MLSRGEASPSVSDPTLERTLRGHRGAISTLAFSPGAGSAQLASGGADHTVMVWAFRPSLRAFRFVGHSAPVTCAALSPDGALLASGSKDCSVRLWPPSVCVPARSPTRRPPRAPAPRATAAPPRLPSSNAGAARPRACAATLRRCAAWTFRATRACC